MSEHFDDISELHARERLHDEGIKEYLVEKNDDEKEVCSFCKKVLERRTYEIAGVKRDMGFVPCDCKETKENLNKYNELFKKYFTEQKNFLVRQKVERMIKESNLPVRFKTRKFDSFIINDENKKAYELAKKYADTFDPKEGRGLVYTGTVGTGKTHLAAAITLQLIEHDYRVVFGTVTTLLNEIRSTYDNKQVRDEDVFRKFVRCDLLVIDDLGKEKVTDWVEQTIYEIINTRYENNKSLIITSNIGFNEIKAKYTNTGDAIISRIIEMCDGTKMSGEDYRKRDMR